MSTVRRIIAVLAVVGTCCAVAGPAVAGEFNVNRSGTYVPVHRSVNHLAALKNEQPTVVHVSAASGFDWGDAGIGAGIGVAIAAIVFGGGLARSQRRASNIGHA